MALQEELNPKDIETAMGAETDTNSEAMEMTPEDLELSLSSTDATSETRKQNMVGQIASARGAGLDAQELAMAEFEFDQDLALNDAVQGVYGEMEAELAGAGERAVLESRLDPMDIAQKLTAGSNEIAKLKASPVASEWATLKQAADAPLDPDVHKEIALQFAMSNTLGKLADEMGWADYVADFAGMVVPFRDTAAWAQLKGGVRGNPVLSQYINGQNIEGMINSWQGLDPARKEALYPTLIQTIVDSMGFTVPVPFTKGIKMDGNDLQAISMILKFFQPDGGRRASVEQKVFAAIDIADLGITAATAAIKLQKAAKAAKRFGTTAETPPISVDGTVKSAADRFTPQVDVQAQAKAAGRAARKEASAQGASKKAARDIGKQARKDERSKLLDEAGVDVRIRMEGIMMGAMDRAVRENSIPKLLAKAGAKGKAADINIGAMTTPEVAKAYGIRSDDAIENAMPFQTTEWMPQVISGLVPETAKKLNDFLRKAEHKVSSMTQNSDLMRLGILNKAERQAATTNFIDDMERIGEDMLLEGITLSEVKVIDDTASEAFTFEYTITRTTDAVPETFKGRRSWHVSEATGNYMETVVDLVSTSSSDIPGLSPKAWSIGEFNRVASEAHNLQDIDVASASRVQALWLDANRNISGPTQGRARARVDAVEIAGDEYVNPGSPERGKLFTPRELAAGIKVTAKKGDEAIIYLTDPREVEAYYMRRLVADSFSGMQNYVTRRELEVLGFKQIAVRIGEDSVPLIARPFETVAQAQASVRSKKGFELYNGTTGKVEVIDADEIAKAYDNGHILTRLQEDWNVTGNQQMLGGKHVEFILTQRGGVHSLPQQVVHYKQGYVPKISEGVEYVVQQLFPYKKAGSAGGTKTKALRMFASKMDADKFIVKMATKMAAKTGSSLEDAMKLFQRGDGSVMGQVERMQNNMSGSNGMFTGTRAQDDILMGLDGVAAERMSPGEAYGRYIDHLGTQVSKNEWRMAKEQQWINTARETFPELRIGGFSTRTIPSDTEEGKALIKLHKQIQQWNRVPSRKETMYQAQVQFLNDWMLVGLNKVPGLSLKAIPNFMNLKHKNPINSAMSASMHLMLGTMNMAQLYVQSVTSVVALSLRPIKESPGIIGDAWRMGYLDNIRDDTALSLMARRMAGASDETVRATGDAWDMYQLWLRGGQREAVRSNADMNYMASTGLGMMSDTARKAGNLSLSLYRSGELVNRRISFASAYRWAKQNHPSMDFKSDDFLAKVLSRSNLTMLELNSANKAWWQGGKGATASQKVAQMGTQFLQVGAKTTELAFKGPKRGGFTLREKGRIVIGQAVMFGSAGVPPLAWFGPEIVQLISDGMGLDPADMDDLATIKAIANGYNQGMIGVIAREGFGADVKLASRTAIAANIAETAWDILASDDPMMLKMLGVSGVVGERLYTGFKQAKSDWDMATSATLEALATLEPYSLADRSGQETLTLGDMVSVASSLKDTLAEIPSSTRSFTKAYIMHHHDIIMSRTGQVTVAKDFSLGTEVAVAFGFQTNDEAELNVVTMDRKDMEKVVRDVSDIIVKEFHNLKFIHDKDPDMATKLRKKVQFLQERMGNPWMVEKLRSSLKSRLKDNPQSKQERELSEYFLRHMHNEITNATMVDQGLSAPLQSASGVVVPFADIATDGEE